MGAAEKGEATVDFVKGVPERVKGEVQTPMRVKNTSKGSDGAASVRGDLVQQQREVRLNGIYRHSSGSILRHHRLHHQLARERTSAGHEFKHANGTIEPIPVKKLP